ncbi:MAG TPA: YCF48-related protein, partial [Bacteroidia bacterium]
MKIFLTGCILFTGLNTFAKEVQPLSGILKTTPAHTVNRGDSVEISVSKPAGTMDYNVKNIISLKLDQNTDTFLTAATTVRTKLSIYRWDADSIAISPVRTENFSVSVNNRYNKQTIDLSSLKLTDGYRVLVVIDSIFINGTPVSTLPKFVYVESEIFLTRYYDFSAYVNTEIDDISMVTYNTDCDTGNIADELELNWGTIDGAEEYQLEWTYVNNYGTTPTSYKSTSQLLADFKNNSTRITTKANTYKLSLTYEKGYIAFRARAVGRDYMDPEVFMYSVWSEADTGRMNTIAANARYQVLNAHENNKNWQYSSTFAEEGKKKEVISYFDGSLHNRQSVTKVNSDRNVIVGETIYDHQGRPAINVLPVPVTFPDCDSSTVEPAIKFYPRFNVNLNNAAYSKSDFDLDDTTGACNTRVPGMDTLSGASQYYSGNNPDKSYQQAFLPDAKLYPFSHVEYTPDNTGRIRSQSGVGEEFQLGSGHETKYIYGQPNQIQLDRLFGSEAGDASHYKKNIVIDANGQSSVSYLNQEGKTVATALAGNAPTDSAGVFMEALPSESDGSDTLLIDLFNKNSSGVSLLNKITTLQDGIEFSTQLPVAYAGNYKFTYDLSVSSFADSCMKDSICMSCIYDLEIRVTDECGTNLVSPAISKTVGHLDTIPNGFTMVCTDSSGYEVNDSVTVFLGAGSYTVSKILTINQDAKRYYIQKYLDTTYNSCFRTLADFVAEQIAALDTTACYTTCSACVDALGTRDEYVSSGRGTEVEYDFLYEECLEPCMDITLCDASYEMMLIDVSPGGQYGKFDESTVTSTNNVSVFNVTNSLNPNKYTGYGNWKMPRLKLNGNEYRRYIDENGTRVRINVSYNEDSTAYYPEVDYSAQVYTDAATGLMYTYPENLKYLGNFMSAWRPSFARSLVMFHPEYAYYIACSDHKKIYSADTMSSNQFDSLMMVSQTFLMAYNNGFIQSGYDSTGINPINKFTPVMFKISGKLNDPFFTNTGYSLVFPKAFAPTVSHLQASMQSDMTQKFVQFVNIAGINYSMPEMAAYMARCGSNFTSIPTASCMAFGTDMYDYTVANYAAKNDSIRDKEWSLLRGFYLSEKRKLQFKRMNFYALNYNRASPSPFLGGCNSCIPGPFNAYAAGMYLPYNVFAYPRSQWYNKRQPCGIYTFANYAGKQKRFSAPDDFEGADGSGVGYSIYQQTGQCPMAFLLQNFLSEMAADSILNSAANVSLSTIDSYSPDMYTAFNNGTTPTLFKDYYWDVISDTLDVLDAWVKDPVTGAVVCKMQLDVSGSSVSSIGEITGISGLAYDSVVTGGYAFHAVASYLVGDTALASDIITGTTCLNIKDCNFTPECSANQFAADFSNMMNSILQAGQLFSGGYYVSADSLVDPAVTPTIKNMLGVPNSNLKWKFTSPKTYELYDSLNTGTKLRMTYISITPAVSSGLIGGFTNIRSNYNNLFKMDVLDTTGMVISEITGKMELVSGSGTTGISMGDCAFPPSPECSTTEHQVRTDLEKLIAEFIVKDSLNDINLFSQVNFSALLQSYLPSALTATGSTYTFDTTALNSNDTLRFDMDDACGFEIWHSVHDTNAVAHNFTDLVAITGLTGIEPMDAAGNFYDFYFIGIYNNGGSDVSDTIRGTSCWPLKNCADCDSTSTSPSAMDSTVTNIPVVYNGWSIEYDAITIDTLVCDTAYQAFVAVLQNYNSSPYALANSDTMDVNIIPTFNMFIQSGYCGCNYTEYLQEYIDDTTLSLPLPVDIDHYTGCEHTDDMSNADYCKVLHGQVLAAANAYNNFIKPLMDSLHYPGIDVNSLPTGSEFTSKYCNCGEKFIAGLVSIINGYSPDSAVVYQMIQLENSCVTAPCVPAVKDTLDFVPPPVTYSPNPCVQQMLNIAVLNAQNTYGQYIDSMSTSIAQRYTEHCLEAIENFNYSYTDKEYHYTLYYYDQAGNLVKTVPPEGVELLDIDSSTDPLEIMVKQDREQNTQRVFSNHRMATNYEYNSLNQLVFQDMPDHDKMQMIDYTLPNGLDSRLKIVRTQFVNAAKGYLAGYVGARGYLYTSDNGGNNWRRVNNTVATDLNDVFFATASIGYAVGNDGIYMKTSNGGMTWTAVNLHSSYKGDFNAVWFTSGTAGVVGGAKTASSPALFYTTDGGSTMNSSADFAIGDTITAITHDGSSYYASVKNNGTGKIYKSSNGSVWNEVTKMRANNLDKVRYLNVSGNVMAYAAGEDGTLLKTPLNSTASWQLVQTGTSKAFRDVYFSTQLNGVAIIDSVSGKGQIWKTFDGGNNWELLSPPGLYYTSLQEYQGTKALACGENGLISRVLMSTAPFGLIIMEKPSATSDLQYADAVIHSGNPQIVAAGNNDTLFYVENAGVPDLDWKTIKTSSLGVSSGDANYKKVLIKDSLNTLLKGMLLTQNGKLYSMYKNAGDTFSFSIALIKDLSGGTISSYFFNDITMDSHTSPKFYAYDTISKRAFRGSITSGTATFVYMDTVTAQQKNIRSIAADSAAGNFVLAGAAGTLKHKLSPNSGTTGYSNRTFTAKPVPLNGISARYDYEVYAAGEDGSIWGTFEGNTWKLLNSGISDDINKIKIKTNYATGILACDSGRLYIQNAPDTATIALTAVDVNTEEDLTAAGVSNDLAYVGTSGGKMIRIADISSPAYSDVNVEQMSGSFHGMSFRTGLDNVYAVGDGASIYQAFEGNSVRVNEQFTYVLTGISFTDANNGYIVSQKSDIRRTTDGGNTWKVIVPQTVPTLMNNVYATKSNQALILGSDKHLSVVNGDASPVAITVSAGASGVDLYAIDFNKAGYGVLAGEERNV